MARRWLPLVLAVTGLLALAALASHGHPLTGSRGNGPSRTFFDYVFTTVVLVAAAIVVLFVVAMLLWRRTGARPQAITWRWWHLLSFVGSMAVALLIVWLLLHSHLRHNLHKELEHVGKHQSTNPPARQVPQNAPGARLRWDEIAVVAALLAAAGVAAFATRKKRTLKEWRFGPHDEVALALDESLDDLRNEPDVRRAIIAAYARMERALAGAGIPRRPSEAPFHYMARALQQLDASSGAATRLTDLFERAKFSHHDPHEAMRDEAIAALVAVRDELRNPVEVAA